LIPSSPILILLSLTLWTKPSAQIGTCDAESVFELLNYHDQELTFDRLVEIRQQSPLEEDEEPGPQPKDRIVTVLRLAEGLVLRIMTGTDSSKWTGNCEEV
jgi:hypothetical protein